VGEADAELDVEEVDELVVKVDVVLDVKEVDELLVTIEEELVEEDDEVAGGFGSKSMLIKTVKSPDSKPTLKEVKA
jgi:hypothetical protein